MRVQKYKIFLQQPHLPKTHSGYLFNRQHFHYSWHFGNISYLCSLKIKSIRQ